MVARQLHKTSTKTDWVRLSACSHRGNQVMWSTHRCVLSPGKDICLPAMEEYTLVLASPRARVTSWSLCLSQQQTEPSLRLCPSCIKAAVLLYFLYRSWSAVSQVSFPLPLWAFADVGVMCFRSLESVSITFKRSWVSVSNWAQMFPVCNLQVASFFVTNHFVSINTGTHLLPRLWDAQIWPLPFFTFTIHIVHLDQQLHIWSTYFNWRCTCSLFWPEPLNWKAQ